jgi:ABC-type glycerol-3-phosphate transport system substrate-binding protein
MGLMPLPAWTPGGRRTSVWGGSGLIMMKRTKNPELAWELAKFLYFRQDELGKRFTATNILPMLKDSWHLPEIEAPNAYYSGDPIGKQYAALAPDTPPVYSSPVDAVARTRFDDAYNQSALYYEAHGETGLDDKIREELAAAAAAVRRLIEREQKLAVGGK